MSNALQNESLGQLQKQTKKQTPMSISCNKIVIATLLFLKNYLYLSLSFLFKLIFKSYLNIVLNLFFLNSIVKFFIVFFYLEKKKILIKYSSNLLAIFFSYHVFSSLFLSLFSFNLYLFNTTLFIWILIFKINDTKI